MKQPSFWSTGTAVFPPGKLSHRDCSRETGAAKPPPLASPLTGEKAVDDLSVANLDARIELAQFRSKRVLAFLRRFPPAEAKATGSLPTIDWSQLERQLRSLAGPDCERASWEMEVLRVSARTNPPELFFRDLLTLAWSLIDGMKPSPLAEDAMD